MGNANKTTRQDVGRGLMFLGAIILMLTALLFLMSIWQQEYYGLFSGQTHIFFDFVLGLALLIGGCVLRRQKPTEKQSPSDADISL